MDRVLTAIANMKHLSSVSSSRFSPTSQSGISTHTTPSNNAFVDTPVITVGTYDGGLLGYIVQSSLTTETTAREGGPQKSGETSRQESNTWKKRAKQQQQQQPQQQDRVNGCGEFSESTEGEAVANAISCKLALSFAVTPHVGCVKAVTSNKHHLLTGSSDESIRIYSLSSRREVGVLNSSTAGSITALSLIGKSFFLSGDSCGRLQLWRCADWQPLHCMYTSSTQRQLLRKKKKRQQVQMKKRNTATASARENEAACESDEESDQAAFAASSAGFGVRSVAVDPTGRMCLVLCENAFLQLWNLMNATCAAQQQLPQLCDSVRWGLCGKVYGLLSKKNFLVIEATDSTCCKQIPSVAEVAAAVSSSSSSPATAALRAAAALAEDRSNNDALLSPATWNCQCFAPDRFVLLGDSSGRIWGFSQQQVQEKQQLKEQERGPHTLKTTHLFVGQHRLRVKGIELVSLPRAGISTACNSSINQGSSNTRFTSNYTVFASGDASGCVHLWAFIALADKNVAVQVVAPIATVQARCRLTCLTSSFDPDTLSASEFQQRPQIKRQAQQEKENEGKHQLRAAKLQRHCLREPLQQSIPSEKTVSKKKKKGAVMEKPEEQPHSITVVHTCKSPLAGSVKKEIEMKRKKKKKAVMNTA